MTELVRPESIVALQTEIRQVGLTRHASRLVLRTAGAGAALLFGAGLALGLADGGRMFVRIWHTWLFDFLMSFTKASILTSYLLVPIVVAGVAAHGLYGRSKRLRLRRRLRELPREQLAQLLLSLRADALSDTRRFVEPLIRDLRADATEVIPAPSPEGGIGEVAAVAGSPSLGPGVTRR